EEQLFAAVSLIEAAHSLAHAQRSGNRSIGGREGRHHRVAAGLDHGAALGGDDLVENLKMRSDQVKRDQVAKPLIEFGRASEIGEQECQAGDLQALIDIDRVDAVDVAEDLAREQPLCRKEWLTPAEKLFELAAGDPQPGQ